MLQSVQIRGKGIAAQACCALLRRFGWTVNTPDNDVPAVPYLVVNSVTLQLIEHIFGIDVKFLQGYRISHRLVVNYRDASISKLAEAALVCSSQYLGQMVLPGLGGCSTSGAGAWRVFAGEPPPEGRLIFSGNRQAWVFEASSRGGLEATSAIFEFIPQGWFFWAPISARKGFVQLVLPQPHEDPVGVWRLALKHTRILKRAIVVGDCLTGPVACAAALHNQLTGPDWIATGSSALRYDSISGDGTGASLRSALLACATLRSITDNVNPGLYLRYYRQRLRMAFRKHLDFCESLYKRAGLSNAWDAEMMGFRWPRRLHDSFAIPPTFRLCNCKLVPLEGS